MKTVLLVMLLLSSLAQASFTCRNQVHKLRMKIEFTSDITARFSFEVKDNGNTYLHHANGVRVFEFPEKILFQYMNTAYDFGMFSMETEQIDYNTTEFGGELKYVRLDSIEKQNIKLNCEVDL